MTFSKSFRVRSSGKYFQKQKLSVCKTIKKFTIYFTDVPRALTRLTRGVRISTQCRGTCKPRTRTNLWERFSSVSRPRKGHRFCLGYRRRPVRVVCRIDKRRGARRFNKNSNFDTRVPPKYRLSAQVRRPDGLRTVVKGRRNVPGSWNKNTTKTFRSQI